LADERDPATRQADHAAIEELARDLLPALVAKLSASGLGEIEVREGTWKVRVRRPADGAARDATRRGSDRSERGARGRAGGPALGHGTGTLDGQRSSRDGRGSGSSNGAHPGMAAVGPGPGSAHDPGSAGSDNHRSPVVAASPAVGIYQARPGLTAGTRVRAGDTVGFVDVLGVPQEVIAPVDGIVTGTLVEPGDAVEYGQDLVTVQPGEARA
jgi:biotin carboxyl carrier protein